MKFRYEEKFVHMTQVQIRNSIRFDSMTNPVKFAAIQSRAVQVSYGNNRAKTFIRCCHCEGLFTRAQIEAHHVAHVGKLESTAREDVIAFGERMFPRMNGYEALCIPCHKSATRLQKVSINNEGKYVH